MSETVHSKAVFAIEKKLEDVPLAGYGEEPRRSNHVNGDLTNE
jgi:hypothetical protein